VPQPLVGTQLIILAANALHRAAWCALITQQLGIKVWGMAANQVDFSALPKPPNPATTLMDFPHPSPEFVSEITKINPDCGLLIMVKNYDLVEVVTLLQAGAIGCLSRDVTVADMARAVIAVGRGEIVLPPTLAAKALTALARGEVRKKQSGAETLTDRESDVIGLLAKGMTNKDIAQTLFLSVRTVEAHLRNIYGKLGVASRTEAVLWAVEHGWETH
jgi:DNA-binding NarL/FixJ family response regulator